MENRTTEDRTQLAKAIAAAVMLSLLGTIPGMVYEWLMGRV